MPDERTVRERSILALDVWNDFVHDVARETFVVARKIFTAIVLLNPHNDLRWHREIARITRQRIASRCHGKIEERLDLPIQHVRHLIPLFGDSIVGRHVDVQRAELS